MTKLKKDPVLKQIQKSIAKFEARRKLWRGALPPNLLPALYAAEVVRKAQLTGNQQLVVVAQHFGDDIARYRLEHGCYPTTEQFAAYQDELAGKFVSTPIVELLNLL